MTAFKVVIPARYGSTRLPGKPLLPIAGRPMIVHVCQRALETGAEVVLATDDARILQAVSGLPVRALLTRPDHGSGTERISEVVDVLGWGDRELVVNLQGDEPLMRPDLIRRLATALAERQDLGMATLATRIRDPAEVLDPHVVKTVTDRAGHALYFSRAPIPYQRDSCADGPQLEDEGPWLRHIGVYAYSVGFLRRYVRWPRSPLETVEALEQLRVLWHGERILVLPVEDPPEGGVDTEADWRRVEATLTAR